MLREINFYYFEIIYRLLHVKITHTLSKHTGAKVRFQADSERNSPLTEAEIERGED